MLKHRSVLLIIISCYAIAITCALLYILALTARYGGVIIVEPNIPFLISETLLLYTALGLLIANLIYHFCMRSPP